MNDEFLKKAMDWASANKPDTSMSHKAAFANSVAYYCSGWSGGYGGPSMREHLCSWALAGDEGLNETASLNGLAITIQYPDSRLPRAGHWDFEEAVKFCTPLCFDPAENYRNRLLQIQEREHCFDDDPIDLETLRGK
ncbi:hypothetical protein Cl131_gp128 [Aphanizomenon phage vB_AphaS-CL131]|nr:hypothetical protein Cl131_gp128 [Aphanizomenon phage vB_AphaS-CL131]